MRIATAIAILVGASACSGEATTDAPVGPTGDPAVRFSDPASGGDPQCVAIGDDASVRVPLLVDVDEVLLRPPGGCGAIAQCGHLALYAGGVFNNETSVPAIDLLVAKLGDPYHDGSIHQGTGEPDVLTVRVDVVRGPDGGTLLDRAGDPLSDTVDLITVVTCE